MSDAPERIRVARDADGFWTCREAVIGSPEYVRADLAALREAPVAAAAISLAGMVREWNSGRHPFAEGGLEQAIENRLRRFFLASPAAPVAVKALEWRKGYCDETVTIQQASNGWLYQVRVLDGDIWLDWPDKPATGFASIEAAKAAAQADYETRIRSALTASPASQGVESRKTFVVPDGFEAVFDDEGRATGQVRPRAAALSKAKAGQFPPTSCSAWEDCKHDGHCHDPEGCGGIGPNSHQENEARPDAGVIAYPVQGVVTPVKRMESWQVPAHELDDTELDLEYEAAAAKFDSRGEHGGSPGEFWAERMDEIEHERKRRRAAAPEQEKSR